MAQPLTTTQSDDEAMNELEIRVWDALISATGLRWALGLVKAPFIGGIFAVAGCINGLSYVQISVIFFGLTLTALFQSFRKVLQPVAMVVLLLSLIETFFPGALAQFAILATKLIARTPSL